MVLTEEIVAAGCRQVLPSDPLYHELLAFYHREAWLLDNRQFDEWLECLDDAVVYAMPFRLTLSGEAATAFGAVEGGVFDETRTSLARRCEIACNPGAWGEVPHARTRHFLSNLIVEQSEDDNLHTVVNLLLTSFRSNESRPEMVVAERRDVVSRAGDSFRILRREVLIDNGSLSSRALTMPV